MEGRRRLGDGLAISAGDLLTDMLDHLPGTRNHLQRLGDILAQLGQLRAAAARAAGWRGDHHPLARQMLGEGLARGPLATEARHRRGPGCGRFGHQLVLGGRGFQLLELQLHLVEQPAAALGMWTEPIVV
jgi:hypothetical protein